jgi:hypothetical protein
VNDEASYWSLPLARAGSVGRLSIARSETIFCERTQALSALNQTASRIWSVLEASGSCGAAAADLVELGASAPDARAFVASAASDWLKKGYFFPKQTWVPIGERRYQVGPLKLEVRYFGDADPKSGEEVLGCFPATSHLPTMSLDVRGHADRDFIFLGGAPIGMHPRADTPAVIKALVTEQLCATCDSGFLTHGALLSSGGKTVVLAGQPGAGKTTLTLALAASGLEYRGDDIVLVDDRGFALGMPFAAATKEGAWPLLRTYVPGLMDLPVRRRTDGKQVRYVRPEHAPLAPQRIDAVLLLSRQAGVSAGVASIDPVEALCFLIDGSFSHRGKIERAQLGAFASAVGAARCGRLTYSELEPAIAAVKAFVDG